MELKTLRIDKDTHTRLKIFCATHGVGINVWVDGIINQTLDKIITKNVKKIKNNGDLSPWEQKTHGSLDRGMNATN